MGNIVDSGERREFESGAVRDIKEGKGRCDLLPLEALCSVYSDDFLVLMYGAIRNDCTYLEKALPYIADQLYPDSFTAFLELSIHYEDGARKYGERNWEKGIPAHCYVDSAIRHYLKYLRGDKDERHDRAVLWNLAGAIWTIYYHPELNDLPYNLKEQK